MGDLKQEYNAKKEELERISDAVIALGEMFDKYDQDNGNVMAALLHGIMTLYLDGNGAVLVYILSVIARALDIEMDD